MNEKTLIKKYEKHRKSKQYYAELFVRKYCKQVKNTDLIIIKSSKASRKFITSELQFQKVVFETLTGRVVLKKQKSVDGFNDSIVTKAMQWYSDQELIKQNQKAQKRKFVIVGDIVTNPKPQPNLFISTTPVEIIKKYEKKKVITWDESTIKYINPNFLDYEQEIFKIINIEELTKCHQEKRSQIQSKKTRSQPKQEKPQSKNRQSQKNHKQAAKEPKRTRKR